MQHTTRAAANQIPIATSAPSEWDTVRQKADATPLLPRVTETASFPYSMGYLPNCGTWWPSGGFHPTTTYSQTTAVPSPFFAHPRGEAMQAQ